MTGFARFIVGDTREVLRSMPDASVDLVVTSPPFLALRSYLPADHPDKAKEIGSEATPAAFLDTLLELTGEWRRVLAPHGSICVELGDTYAGSGGAGGDYGTGEVRDGQQKFNGSALKDRKNKVLVDGKRLQQGDGWPLAKSLCGIPTLYAWSLAYGFNLLNPGHRIEPWRVRNLIAWTRPNPPVGALGDKVRPATSYVTTACVGTSRYFDLDAERTAGSPNTHARTAKGVVSRPSTGKTADDERRGGNFSTLDTLHETRGAPLLDHWNIPTQPYTGSHYAAFPEELPRRLISLMCPPRVCRECGKPSERVLTSASEVDETNREYLAARAAARHGERLGMGSTGRRHIEPRRVIPTGEWSDCGHDNWRPGIVLDPFAGSGTTLAVAVGMGREAIGIDLDPRNAHLAEQRVGMFLDVAHFDRQVS